jgi:hypothetical protein
MKTSTKVVCGVFWARDIVAPEDESITKGAAIQLTNEIAEGKMWNALFTTVLTPPLAICNGGLLLASDAVNCVTGMFKKSR